MASQGLILKLNNRGSNYKKQIGMVNAKYGCHITPNLKNENLW